mmetsp:Transcript_86257/g.225038  ORF Transcript_86257/g.225038 Transcript_86257/m.225038 type:complete len:359 (+) Transcript_86257:116-1192(+)
MMRTALAQKSAMVPSPRTVPLLSRTIQQPSTHNHHGARGDEVVRYLHLRLHFQQPRHFVALLLEVLSRLHRLRVHGSRALGELCDVLALDHERRIGPTKLRPDARLRGRGMSGHPVAQPPRSLAPCIHRGCEIHPRARLEAGLEGQAIHQWCLPRCSIRAGRSGQPGRLRPRSPQRAPGAWLDIRLLFASDAQDGVLCLADQLEVVVLGIRPDDRDQQSGLLVDVAAEQVCAGVPHPGRPAELHVAEAVTRHLRVDFRSIRVRAPRASLPSMQLGDVGKAGVQHVARPEQWPAGLGIGSTPARDTTWQPLWQRRVHLQVQARSHRSHQPQERTLKGLCRGPGEQQVHPGGWPRASDAQ